MGSFLAHIAEDGREQSVKSHCQNTAAYASQALAGSIHLPACGYLAGLIHDMGKYTTAFQRYLRYGKGYRGSVNHTFAGVRFFLERFHQEPPQNLCDIAVELLALAVGGHHGLFDCVDSNGKNGFCHRLGKEDIDYEEATANFLLFCAEEDEISQRIQDAQAELVLVIEKILSMTKEDSKFFDDETAFYSGLLARLLLSAVIEGDRRDTAEFKNNAQLPLKQFPQTLEQLWMACLSHMEDKLSEFPRRSEIDRARWAISDQCRKNATLSGGVFRLNVPTGSGKTLSSLRFALAHAMEHKKQRIIFTSPLLSILDQNAKEIRKYVGNDDLIFEHHSNLVHTKNDAHALDCWELFAETWEAPIILTTLAQFLNVLFSGKTTAIRRFHSLCDSVIVIDEVQTVPTKMLSLFSLAVNFLSQVCGATVVLCSATQPCIEQIEHPLHLPIHELVPYSHQLWGTFRRTEIQYVGELSLEGIAQFALEKLKSSLLIVCNKKIQAERLFHLLGEGDFDLFLLSAAMCIQHRQDVLENLRATLNEKKHKVICVSTQVIEAGVDISFSCVIRLTAGMDNVIQAAGRCNRNGEAGPGVFAPVYLVGQKNEGLGKLPDIQFGKNATQELLTEIGNHPRQYGGRLDSDQAIGYYYRRLYQSLPKHTHDYVQPQGGPSLFSLLSLNAYCLEEPLYYFRQAFRTAGVLFQVFEENTVDVIVPYGKGCKLITDLCGAKATQDFTYLKGLLAQAKPFTIPLYQYQIDRLQNLHALTLLPGGVLGLHKYYDKKIGFSMGNEELEFMEV